jgi:ABC-type Fe2+-enterobactin transport system substrate-binding protein
VRAEPDLLIVHREVGEAAAELKEQLAGVAVSLVLLDGVVDRLLREIVLQLERADGKAVDEEGQIEGEARLVLGVAKLTDDAEDIGGVPLDSGRIARGRSPVE